MNRKLDIVYISNDYSADNRTSSHHIAKRLLDEHRLLYVEAGGTRAPRASKRDFLRIFSKLYQGLKGGRKINKDLYIMTAIMPQFVRWGWLRRLNAIWVKFMLQRALKKAGFSQQPVMWCVQPTLAEIVSQIDKSLLVYYCVDEFSALPGVNVERLQRLDRLLTESADLVFTPSTPLFEKKRLINNHTVLSPHGVDVSHFGKASDNSLEIPAELAKLNNPILGFFGLIEHWIDLPLVFHLARALPNASIVMIGRVAVDIGQHEIPENVHFLGQRPYEKLPLYARGFDVALIPYVLNDQVFNANPLKLREYLATGKPIVSVRNPEIEKYDDVVNIADEYNDFVEKVEACLSGNAGSTVAQRMARVGEESWDNRYKVIMSIVNEKISKS